MYKLGTAACLFVVVLIWACGCSSVPGSGTATAGTSVETPTLPAMYIAGETTPTAESAMITSTPTPPNATAANIFGAQVNTTLTEVTIACTGQTCTSGTTNSTTGSSGSTTPVNPPVSAISANVTMAYVKQNPNVAIQFTDSSANSPPYSWMWSWGPGGNLTYESDPSIVLVFSQYGTYEVTRTVSNSVGTSSSSTNVSVCPLVASFTQNQTTGPVPLTVMFTDSSTDQPVAWNWNFGDGATTSLQNPVHTYRTSGIYTVRLDATNALGSCGHTSSVSVSSLAASFTQNQTTGLVPLTVLFSDTSTDQPVEWNWNFGDGGTSTLQNPVHTYLAAGTYTINFSAFNGYDGWMSAQAVKITVWSLPTASFTATPVTGTPGSSIIFNDQSSGFPSPASWYWDFGDGYTSTQQNPSHQYVNIGSYNVSHSATSAQGTTWLNRTDYITIS